MISVSRERQARFDADSRRRCAAYGAPYEPVDLHAVLAKTGGRCYRCRRVLTPELFEPDHVSPLARGGWHTLANLAPMCRPCNRRKAATPPAPDIPPGVVRAVQSTLWRMGIATELDRRIGRWGVVCAPHAWTVALKIDPLAAPRAMQAAGVLSHAVGADVTLGRIGQRVGVRIPRPAPLVVPLRAMPHARGVTVPLGYDDQGRAAWVRLDAHILAAGASGAGKSQALRAIIRGLALGNPPAALRMGLADPSGKMRALAPFGRLQHLIAPVAASRGDAHRLIGAFEAELKRRGDAGEVGPPWVLVVDELLDLEDPTALFRLARLGRELGLHVVAAMQAERAADLDTRAAAQFATRLCFRVAPSDGYTSRMMIGDTRATGLTHPGLAWVHTPSALRSVAVAYAPPGDTCWSSTAWGDVQGAEPPPMLPGGPGNRTPRVTDDGPPPDVADWFLAEARAAGAVVGINRIQKRAGIGPRKAARWQRQLIDLYHATMRAEPVGMAECAV